MSVNQSVNPKVVPGARVLVIDAGYVSGSFLDLPHRLIGKEGIVRYVDRAFTVYVPDAVVSFEGEPEPFIIELQHLVVLSAPASTGEVGTAATADTQDTPSTTKATAPRVNYLYVVEDDDGVYGKTFDRDHAREIKASRGGKKAGVIITAYAAVKEIR